MVKLNQMIKLNRTGLALTALVGMCVPASILAVPISGSPASQSTAQPDNTAQNKNASPTADNQSNVKADRETTAHIRKAIIADKSLSTYAHNIKIITRSGTVTLKGPVRSEDEKQKIEADAASVVAGENVVDQLTVKQ